MAALASRVTALLLLLSVSSEGHAVSLHEAVKRGDLTSVSRIIASGADLKEPDNSGLTPLVLAALEGKLEIVKLLLKQGAPLMGRDQKGFTALHAACHAGRLGVVEYLLESGAQVNDQNNHDKLTPLHLAAERGHDDVVGVLVDSGAAMELRALDGKTPIVMATLKSRVAAIKLLRERGADCRVIRLAKFRDACLQAGN
jgi:ankyrin repeat protein